MGEGRGEGRPFYDRGTDKMPQYTGVNRAHDRSLLGTFLPHKCAKCGVPNLAETLHYAAAKNLVVRRVYHSFPPAALGTVKEPDLHPALSGDEVYTPSPGAQKVAGQLFARCSNRTTSKTSILTLNEQRIFVRFI